MSTAAVLLVTVLAPVPWQIVQRDARGAGAIHVEVDASPANVVLEALVDDEKPVRLKRGGAHFTGNLMSVAGGWHKLVVREAGAPVGGALAEVDHVGVGDVYVVAGQSNSANFGRPLQRSESGLVAELAARGWQRGDDPQPLADGNAGSLWPLLGDLLARELKVPIGFASCGVGGSTSEDWLPKGRFYKCLGSVLRRLGPRGERAVLWMQGESDAKAGVSAETYAANLTKIIRTSHGDSGWRVPWIAANSTYLPKTGEPAQEQIRKARLKLEKEKLVEIGPDLDELKGYAYRYDGGHFHVEGLKAAAARWFATLKKLTR